MDGQPTAQVLWLIERVTVEQHMTVGGNGLSTSLRV
jgi:hypothetical protein